jgi:hypothetical protein
MPKVKRLTPDKPLMLKELEAKLLHTLLMLKADTQSLRHLFLMRKALIQLQLQNINTLKEDTTLKMKTISMFIL